MAHKSNNKTGNVTTDTTWQQLPVSDTGRDWMIYVEGDEILMCIDDEAPSVGAAFKVPAGAAYRWYPVVQPVYIKGVDLVTVVYYMK